MAEEKAEKTPKKGMNPLLAIGCGCLVLLVLAGVGLTVFGGWIAKTTGLSFVQGMIQQKTGIKADLFDAESGKMTFTDPKTGAKVDVGSNKIPDLFPKDFPIYPGAKVTSSLSGAQKGEGSGFWLTMTTPDAADRVAAFYKSSFAKNGWEVTADYSTGDSSTQTVEKGAFSGNVSIARTEGSETTELIIVLTEDKDEPAINNPEDSSMESELSEE